MSERVLPAYVLVACSFGMFGMAGCYNAKPEPFTQALTLGGEEVSAARLNIGWQTYNRYCYACHGTQGDGNGPSAYGLRPPPRDLRSGTYKFGGVVEGLPHDDDFRRILTGGLAGTAMLPWEMSETPADGVIQYIKTFAEVWQDPDEELGEQVLPDPEENPWTDDVEGAIERGSTVYHGVGTCQSCHPAYLTKEKLAAELKSAGKNISFRPDMYDPELKESQIEASRWNSDPPEMFKLKILPPDFLYHDVRTMRPGTEVEDLYRTIGSGIPGTAMPAWYGSIDDEDLWAMAYYVKSLMDMRGTKRAAELRDALANQPDYVPPAKDPPAEQPPAEQPPADGDAAADADAAQDDGKAAAADGKAADKPDAKADKPDAKADKPDAKADKPDAKADKPDAKADAKGGDAKGDG